MEAVVLQEGSGFTAYSFGLLALGGGSRDAGRCGRVLYFNCIRFSGMAAAQAGQWVHFLL